MMLSDVAHHAQLGEWRRAAEEDWKKPGHPGWQILQEEIVSRQAATHHTTMWAKGVEAIRAH